MSVELDEMRVRVTPLATPMEAARQKPHNASLAVVPSDAAIVGTVKAVRNDVRRQALNRLLAFWVPRPPLQKGAEKGIPSRQLNQWASQILPGEPKIIAEAALRNSQDGGHADSRQPKTRESLSL